MKPWIGRNYGHPNDLGFPCRLLFLRESHYGEAEDANNPDFTIQVVGAILKGDNKRRFKNPEKAVLEKNTGDGLNRF